MPPRFRTFSHTADAGLFIYGRTLKDLFKNALAALNHAAGWQAAGGGEKLYCVRLKSTDRAALLVRWINELLYLAAAKNIYASRVSKLRVSGTGLDCLVSGAPKPPRCRREVKAATYHGLSLIKSKDGFSARVILDL